MKARAHDPVPITGGLNHPFDNLREAYSCGGAHEIPVHSTAWYRFILPFEWSHVDCSGQICPLPCVGCDAVVQIQIYTKVVYFSEGYLETIPVSTQYAGDGMLGERRGRGLGCHRQTEAPGIACRKDVPCSGRFI